MPQRSEVSYFGAGPAPLPTPILETSAHDLLNFNNTGLSLAEISHRSPTANKIIADATEALIKLLDIPVSHEIIFLQGGGSGEFSATVQNCVSSWVERRRRRAVKELGDGRDKEVLERVRGEIEKELKLDYLVTGSWSLKASQEAGRLVGKRWVNVVVDGRESSSDGKGFRNIPDEKEWEGRLTRGGGSALTYFCDNETVDGVEFRGFPKCLEGNEGGNEDEETCVVADMSSNFLSRRVDVKKYGVIFVSVLPCLVFQRVLTISRAARRKTLVSLVSPSSSFASHYLASSRHQHSCTSSPTYYPTPFHLSSLTLLPSPRTTRCTTPFPYSTYTSPHWCYNLSSANLAQSLAKRTKQIKKRS